VAKQHQTFDHTADIGVEASADSLAELFEALAEGVAGVTCETGGVQPRELRRVELEQPEEDLEALAVDFLWQLLLLFEQHRFLVRSARVLHIDARRLEAELAGEPYQPQRHELRHEVKAVTWHGLLIARSDAGWQGRGILDLC
jgi:SHS2 domain-containing protein